MNKPEWFDHPIPQDPEFFRMKKRIRESGLHTICQEARCPNAGTCFSEETATFLILGDTCTRKCGFCSVKKGTPLPPEQSEIDRILEMIEGLGLDYAVITSVTRDDLPDGGVGHYLKLLEGLRNRLPTLKIETLIPDFLGKVENWRLLLSSPPDVLNHNIESVRRLYPFIRRPDSQYSRSLEVLRYYSQQGLITKSGLMVGLGESREELVGAFEDLLSVGVKILTIGQYLQATTRNVPVSRFYTPQEFQDLETEARRLGFSEVVSGPLVRSSFKAKEAYRKVASALSHLQ